MEKKHFIYMTTNLINGKRYIGKHFGYENDSYLGSGTLIQKAIKKYGKDNFERKILCFSKDNQENNLNEQLYIKKFNAVMFCYPEREKLIIKELCCRKSDLDNAKKAVSGYFDKEKMEISNIGENPFAMIKPDIFEKVYFNIAMD